MPLLARRRLHRFFDVPVQDLVLRVAGPQDLYEEARAAGLHFWEQVQSYAIRHPEFRTSKRPLPVPPEAPPIVREMVQSSAAAGVGPMFTFQGALTEYVGRRLAPALSEVVVSCGGDHFVIARRRARLAVRPPTRGGRDALAVVVKPELGPHGIYTTVGRVHLPREGADGLVVVARSCLLADAAAAAASAILSRPGSCRPALDYLNGLDGVHGAIVIRGARIGVAGALELAA
jgi:ApbE superfamily uncharacterized protein (UPF0280 family)